MRYVTEVKRYSSADAVRRNWAARLLKRPFSGQRCALGTGADFLKLGRVKEAITAVRIQREVQARDAGYVHGARYLFEALAGLGFVYGETGAKDKACRLAREAQTLLDGPLKKAPVDSDPAKWVRKTAPGCGS